MGEAVTMPTRIRELADSVCKERGVSFDRAMSWSRGHKTSRSRPVDVRFEVWRRIRDEVKMSNGRPPSYPLMGRWFDRHHTAILEGVQKARAK